MALVWPVKVFVGTGIVAEQAVGSTKPNISKSAAATTQATIRGRSVRDIFSKLYHRWKNGTEMATERILEVQGRKYSPLLICTLFGLPSRKNVSN
jgi:hypothetical protein